LSANRARGEEKIWSAASADFFNKIGQFQTHALQQQNACMGRPAAFRF
jgi:hypothetical protein